MNSLVLLDWSLIALSLFNTIILFWLGLAVLLNADRRHWGTWIAGIGFLACACFFVGHSAIVAGSDAAFEAGITLLWPISWLLVIGAPYLWYLVMLAYSGVLAAGRHRAWLTIVTILGVMAVGLLLLSDLLPSFQALTERKPFWLVAQLGVPAIVLIYPVYSVLCVLLSLLALRAPAISERFMGDLARRRARPWLMLASLLLLLICLLITTAATGFLADIQERPQVYTNLRHLAPLIGFDVLISGLLSVVVILSGQAIVSYEVFTGKVLPRSGLRRFWRQSLIIAAGYSLLMAALLSLPLFSALDSIYQVLLASVLLASVLALLTWRSYAERELAMDRLRPFLASQHIYEQLLRPTALPELDLTTLFRALGHDVLGAQLGYLVALGPLAALIAPSLHFSSAERALDRPSQAKLNELASRFQSPQLICLALEPHEYGQAVWAVPLWSERGLIGMLLLGEKRDGSLYTQEEIEIARAGGERLIDSQASTEMARRLMSLQRERLATAQVLDQRTRRVLHDDVLPRLHTVMLQLASENDREHSAVLSSLSDLHRQIANLLQAMPNASKPEVARIGLLAALRRVLAADFANSFEQIDWLIEPEAEQALQALSALQAEVIFYAACEAIRNAARHGRGNNSSKSLRLTISLRHEPELCLSIEDDGLGLESNHHSQAGSGQGLQLHTTMMAIIGGTLSLESVAQHFTRVRLGLPKNATSELFSS